VFSLAVLVAIGMYVVTIQLRQRAAA